MSDTTASLRRQIGSAGDLQSVVRTMKALAASSIGEYEASARALPDYFRTVELGLSACLRAREPAPLMVARHGRTDAGAIGAVVFGSDQGLVGQFNDVVADYAIETLAARPGDAHVWAVGERVHARLTDASLPLVAVFSVPNSVKAITPLVGQILLQSEARLGPRGRHRTPSLLQPPADLRRVTRPSASACCRWTNSWRRELAQRPWPTRRVPDVMGSRTVTLRALIREYVFVSLFRACAESLASEHASRLAAMQRADKNIDELLEHLNRTFQRVRQSGIDEELFDVVAGFEALVRP